MNKPTLDAQPDHYVIGRLKDEVRRKKAATGMSTHDSKITVELSHLEWLLRYAESMPAAGAD